MLIQILVAVIVLVIAIWAISTYFPMPIPIKNILIGVIVLIFCIWALQSVGVFSGTRL